MMRLVFLVALLVPGIALAQTPAPTQATPPWASPNNTPPGVAMSAPHPAWTPPKPGGPPAVVNKNFHVPDFKHDFDAAYQALDDVCMIPDPVADIILPNGTARSALYQLCSNRQRTEQLPPRPANLVPPGMKPKPSK